MALSKDEQRTLDEIERALREEDPNFVSAVSFGRLRRRRIIIGGTAFILGMIALVVGEMVSQVQLAVGVVVSVAGFLGMFVALAWAILPRGTS
jgi:multidrug efflux pump subunit AcrB